MLFYCGFCDSKYVLRSLDDRPVFRATHTKYFFCCGTRTPACEGCSQPHAESSSVCPACEVQNPRQMRQLIVDDDTDDEEAVDPGRNEEDVRIDPPRFTPLARTSMMLPYLWKLTGSPTMPWYETESKACTGCAAPGPLFRCLFDVVMIHEGTTQRYKHKLCFKCAACVNNRPVSIEKATMTTKTTYLVIQQTKIQPHLKEISETSDGIYVSSSGLKIFAGWEHAYCIPYEVSEGNVPGDPR